MKEFYEDETTYALKDYDTKINHGSRAWFRVSHDQQNP